MDYKNITANELIKIRFKDIRKTVKERGFILRDLTDYIIQQEPNYDCPEGWSKIEKFWFGRVADLRLLELSKEFLSKNSN